MDDPLFESLCNKELLYTAWERVREKDTVGGIDFQTVQGYAVTLDKNLDELLLQLQSGKYIQQPYREVYIPKSEMEKRRLGLLTVNDKIIQTAVAILITPIIERSFLNVSYAYRSNKGPVKAINQVRHLITNEKFCWLVSCDIDNFFDTIPHDILFGKLSAYLKSPGLIELVKMFVKMERVNKNYQWKENRKGIPQGSVVSPLLANFYLYPLDKLMVDKGYGYVRYSDDFVIFGHSETEAKTALIDAVKILTHQLGLSLNDGTSIKHVNDGFDFLGISFRSGQIDLSDKKFKRLIEKMSDAAGDGNGLITNKLKETIQGISNFYCKLVPQEKLEKLDDELLAILRIKWDSLGKVKNKRSFFTQIQSIQLFAREHIINKISYLKRQSNISDAITVKNKNLKKKSLKSREAVLSRKHEYQKLESSGFDLAITLPGLMLGKKDKAVTVRHHGSIIKEVPFINLKNISILSEGVSFSSNLVKSCTENKISIDFLGKDGMPYALIIPPAFFDADIGIAQLESFKNGKCYHLISKFVYGKINNQANLVKYYGKYYLKRNEDFSKEYPDFIRKMESLANASISLIVDNVNEFRQKIFAIEGQASSLYWDMIKIIIQSKASFLGRERQGATDLVNCMLNYGYGMLYARITESIVKAHLNPCISYLHKPDGNRPSLVFDLIEEFRQQVVDKVVFALIMKNKNLGVEFGSLNDKTKKLLAHKIIDRINTIEIFRKREMRLFEIIQKQANGIAGYLLGETKLYKPYMPKW